MYYIKLEERKNISESLKQVKRSVNFVVLIDAINELERWYKEITIKHEDEPDYGGDGWQNNYLGTYIYTSNKDIFLTVVYHDEEAGVDYELPDLESMVEDQIELVKNDPTNC